MDRVPRAFAFHVYWCEDPNCGPHIFLLHEDGEPFAEMVLTADAARGLAKEIHDMLYEKATTR